MHSHRLFVEVFQEFFKITAGWGRESQNCYFSQMHFEDKRFTEYIKPLVPKCTPKKLVGNILKNVSIFFCCFAHFAHVIKMITFSKSFFLSSSKIQDLVPTHTVLKSRLSLCRTFFFCSCDALLEKCINKKKRAFASSSVKKILKTFVMAHFFTHLENKPGDE